MQLMQAVSQKKNCNCLMRIMSYGVHQHQKDSESLFIMATKDNATDKKNTV
jgi:hypothetical protein